MLDDLKIPLADSRPDCSWVVALAQPERAAALGAALGLSSLAGQLLINRGHEDLERARRFLAPRLAELRRPDGDEPMAGFATAVARLERAVLSQELVAVFGDYDVDGVTSCAVLSSFLRDAGGRVLSRVARRDAGYGFGVADVAGFAAAGAAVIVTCDCGTSDHEALADARARGIDTIVVDHHQVPDRPCEALALINPHQPACRFPFKGLCSAGVAFYLAAALRTRLRAAGWPLLPDPRALLDLVAIGTIADLAPLTDENRILVHAGLRELARGRRPGLRALVELSGLMPGERRAIEVAMKLGPRLNAPGRLGDAQPALELCMATDEPSGRALAQGCDDANRRRQEIQEKVLLEAVAQVEAGEPGAQRCAALVVAGDWHPGVVGIVAAKLVDRYARPAVVIALDGDLGRGSARTVAGFNLYEGLRGSADLLVRFGGHAAAAGLTIERARVPELRARLGEAARTALGAGPPRRPIPVDAEITLDDIHEPMAEELRRLEPFGLGNPEPCFGARGVMLERSRVVGQGHLQVTLRSGLHARDGIGFYLAERDPGAGSRVRAAFVPEIDEWRGVRRVRIRLRDLTADREDLLSG